MAKQYLRNKVDGFIYDWHPILAANPKCELVTEEEAFPERFIKPAHVERAKRARRGGKPLALATEGVDDSDDEPRYTSPELENDASRGLPT